ncbi:unnamed protein product [Calypogeia fissa]
MQDVTITAAPQQLGNENRINIPNQTRSQGSLPKLGEHKGYSKGPRNRWTLETTLQLLAEMKAQVSLMYNKDLRYWRAIAAQLSNPCGLELGKLALSCKARINNIRRELKGKKRGAIDLEVKTSLAEYDELCEDQKSLQEESAEQLLEGVDDVGVDSGEIVFSQYELHDD